MPLKSWSFKHLNSISLAKPSHIPLRQQNWYSVQFQSIYCKKRSHCLVMLCFKSGWWSPTFARIPYWDIQKQNQYASFHSFTRMLKNEWNSRNGDLKSWFWLSKWWRWKHHSLKSIKFNYLSSQILYLKTSFNVTFDWRSYRSFHPSDAAYSFNSVFNFSEHTFLTCFLYSSLSSLLLSFQFYQY